MRKLKFHEKKLLKKVNFLQWNEKTNLREIEAMKMYHITDRDDYKKYNKIAGMITKLVSIIQKLDAKDPFRINMTNALLEKLYNIGLIPTKKSLTLCDRLSTTSFCRRRLAVLLVRLKFCQYIREAVTFIEQGHIRVGPEIITNPAYMVTRNLEDFVTWVDSSKIKQKILKYNDRLDDYDLLN